MQFPSLSGWLMVAGSIFGLFLLLAQFLLIVDPLGSQPFMSVQSRIVQQTYPATRQSAVVYFTGFDSEGSIHDQAMLQGWGQYGDVIAVNYPRYQFDPTLTVELAYKYLSSHGFTRVYIVGASLGGQMAMRLIRYDRKLHHGAARLHYRVILVDTPVDANDLYLSGASLISHIHLGFIGNWLLTNLYAALSFHPEPARQRGAGVDEGWVNKLHAAAKSWPLSGLLSQLRSIVQFPPPITDEFAGIRAIILLSQKDRVVRRSAVAKLQAAFPAAEVFTVGSGSQHIDFLEHPQEWGAAFSRAFTLLNAG